ncbi:MAG: sigma-70 family RNA polymerase sigma factor [Acidobacteria bacterium]|nr:sigma-70 family RNA polymerase sigma factor [Acidobacteriota bacterium]
MEDRAPHPGNREEVGPRDASSEGDRGEVTVLLRRWASGDSAALETLTPLIYGELRKLAHQSLRREARSSSLETTGLVHEAFVRLLRTDVDWQDRRHFFALSARLIRRVLVDLARERKSDKRGHGIAHMTLDRIQLPTSSRPPDIEALDDALTALAQFDDRKARVVELRFFAGLTIEETADILGVSHATVERDLQAAKAWLAHQILAAGE